MTVRIMKTQHLVTERLTSKHGWKACMPMGYTLAHEPESLHQVNVHTLSNILPRLAIPEEPRSDLFTVCSRKESTYHLEKKTYIEDVPYNQSDISATFLRLISLLLHHKSSTDRQNTLVLPMRWRKKVSALLHYTQMMMTSKHLR